MVLEEWGDGDGLLTHAAKLKNGLFSLSNYYMPEISHKLFYLKFNKNSTLASSDYDAFKLYLFCQTFGVYSTLMFLVQNVYMFPPVIFEGDCV